MMAPQAMALRAVRVARCRLPLPCYTTTTTTERFPAHTALDRPVDVFGTRTRTRTRSPQHCASRYLSYVIGRHAPRAPTICTRQQRQRRRLQQQQQQPHPSRLSQQPQVYRSMSSDADYAAFLDRANHDRGACAEGMDTWKKSVGTKRVNTGVPKALEQVEEYYTSEADEPFEPVALRFDDGPRVSAGESRMGVTRSQQTNDAYIDAMKELLGGEPEVEQVQRERFETQYPKVVEAVKKAGKGEVTVFRARLDATRTEYYVVAVDVEQRRLVGLKALSVES